jgi:WD40 repeat protein
VDDLGVVRTFDVASLLTGDPVQPSMEIDHCGGERLSWSDWSPDGNSLVATHPMGGLLRVEVSDGTSVHFDADVPTPARCVAFHPTLGFFVTGDDQGALRFWSSAGNRDLGVIANAHGGRVYAIDFDETGRLMCTGDSSGKVRIWYVDGRPDERSSSLPAPIFSFDTPHTEVFDVQFAGPDQLVTGGSTTGPVAWDFSALDRYLAGNLEHWIGRFESVADPEVVTRLRAWAASRGGFER